MCFQGRETTVKEGTEDEPRQVPKGIQEMSAKDLAAILSSLLKSERQRKGLLICRKEMKDSDKEG